MGDADFEIPGLERDVVVLWALACNSSCLSGCVQLEGIIPLNSIFVKHFFELSADFADYLGENSESRIQKSGGIEPQNIELRSRISKGGGTPAACVLSYGAEIGV